MLSANDAASLKANIAALCKHLINPSVRVSVPDLAYTLSERRSQFWHRAFVTTNTTEVQASDFTVGKKSPNVPRVGFVFTGQGAQWPQMGRELAEYFPLAREVFEELDAVLKGLSEPPEWNLVDELTQERTAEHLRQPEFSQPLVTALQLAILTVLDSWGVKSEAVVGHSSGEIAAAYAAGFLTRADAIKAAFYRGRAAVNKKDEAERDVGMLAVGLGVDAAAEFLQKYAGDAWIACFNSPDSLTMSGRVKALEALAGEIKAAGHFARLLQVDLAYHSELMGVIGDEYEALLFTNKDFTSGTDPSSEVAMFSSVTGAKKTDPADAIYWKTNMVSPVRFSEALAAMVSDSQKPDILIEIGPSGALAGPVSQVLKSVPAAGDITYFPSWSRGTDASKALFNVAGRLFNTGYPIDFGRVNQYENTRVITDLPNYSWNHTIKYWFEPQASLDWRFKPFVTHDLIGSKVLSSPWQAPTWRKRLDLADVPWLRDHAMGSDVLMPAAGYVAMALEAMYQMHCSLNPDLGSVLPSELAYRFRNVRFDRAFVLEEGKPIPVILSLSPASGSAGWHEFRVMTEVDGTVRHHCRGMVRVQDPVDEPLTGANLAPLRNPTAAKLWYKAQNDIGMGFGPAFQKVLSIEATSGQQTSRARLSLEPPKSKWDPQSYYPIHPAVLDGCLQTVTPALVAGERSRIQDITVPSVLDDIIINKVPKALKEGLSLAESVFTERGRKDQLKSYYANVNVYDPETGALFVRVRGMHVTKLDGGPKSDPHTFHRVSWKPDVSLLTEDQLVYLTPDETERTKVDAIIDLVAHKNPTLNVLEVSLNGDNTSSLWFDGQDPSARAAYSEYHYTSTDAQAVVTVQTQYESRPKTSFTVANPTKKALGLPAQPLYNLAIVRAPKNTTSVAVEDVMANLQPLLTPNAFALFIATSLSLPIPGASLAVALPEGGFAMPLDRDDLHISSVPDSEVPSTPEESSGNTSDTSASLASEPLKSFQSSQTWSRQTLRRVGGRHFSSFIEVDSPIDGGTLTFLARPTSKAAVDSEPWTLLLVSATSRPSQSLLSPTLQGTLERLGWRIKTSSASQFDPSIKHPRTVTLVLDELFRSALTQITEQQWDGLKSLVSSGTPLLWVTTGSQHTQVSKPDRALVHGLFRVIRREDPTAKLTVLDVQSATSPATVHAISSVLSLFKNGGEDALVETEYVERDGVLYAQRILPDQGVNGFRKAEAEGAEAVVKGFHESEVLVRMHAERVGTMDMGWYEEESVETDLEEDTVEVEVSTVGVNFKVPNPIFSMLSLAWCLSMGANRECDRMWLLPWELYLRTSTRWVANAPAL